MIVHSYRFTCFSEWYLTPPSPKLARTKKGNNETAGTGHTGGDTSHRCSGVALAGAFRAGGQSTMIMYTLAGTKYSRRRLGAMTAMAVVLLSNPAISLAQEPQGEETAGQSATTMIDTIIITARQRDERLQDVPESIAVLTAETLEAARVDSVQKVTLFVPNVNLFTPQNPGTSFLSIRGVGQIRLAEPPVAMAIDGVLLTTSYQLTQELFDIERVEVLKGPQGALYGRNAIGGAINITTRAPGNEFEGKVSAEFGNGEDWRLLGSATLPLIEDKLSIRISGSYQNFDGVIENEFLGTTVDYKENVSFRTRALATPNDRLSIDLRVSIDSLDSGSSWYVPIFGNETIADSDKPVSQDKDGASERDLREYAAKIDYEFDFATFTSITAYSSTEDYFESDFDWFPVPALAANQAVDVEAWSQELRLTSPSDQRFRWVFGGYYVATEREIRTNIFANFGNLFGLAGNLAGGLPDPPVGLDPIGDLVQIAALGTDEDNEAYALFGQVNYDIVENLELTLALRYDDDRREQLDINDGITRKTSFDRAQPKVSLAYKATPDLMGYATVSWGFRSGGFNPNDLVQRVYDAERLTNYEVGLKSTLANGMLTVNAAGFYMDYKDRQTYFLEATTASQVIINIPKSRITGFEIDATARPIDGLQLNAALGILDAEIRDFDPSFLGVTQNVEGNKLDQVPSWSYTLGANFTMPVTDTLDVVLAADFKSYGGVYWTFDNADEEPTASIFNGRISLESDQWSVTLWAENLFDVAYNEEFQPRELTGFQTDILQRNTPRRYGVRLSYQF